MDTNVAILVAVVALAVLAAAAVYIQRRRSHAMRARYGAEYIAAVDEAGDRRKAEAELRRREKRVERLHVRPLEPAESDRFQARWREVQVEFVDDPGRAIARADELIGDVMQSRNYPVGDFEQRAADLSVEHPRLVSDYRIAHEVALRHAAGEADTEDLRRAMIHYRALFEDLVEPPAGERRPEERRAFSQEEAEDERTAGIRGEDDGQRADDRGARERRRGRPGDDRATQL